MARIVHLEKSENLIFYTQEYYRQNLQEILNGKEIQNCEYLAHGILSGILHLHNNNIRHLNLKPNNILIDDNNNIKLCDLYFQGKVQNNKSQLHWPQEQININSSFQSDYFSVGAILCDIFGLSYEKNALQIKEGKLPVVSKGRVYEIELAISMMYQSKVFRKDPSTVLNLYQKKHKIKKYNLQNYKLFAILFILISFALFIFNYQDILTNLKVSQTYFNQFQYKVEVDSSDKNRYDNLQDQQSNTNQKNNQQTGDGIEDNFEDKEQQNIQEDIIEDNKNYINNNEQNINDGEDKSEDNKQKNKQENNQEDDQIEKEEIQEEYREQTEDDNNDNSEDKEQENTQVNINVDNRMDNEEFKENNPKQDENKPEEIQEQEDIQSENKFQVSFDIQKVQLFTQNSIDNDIEIFEKLKKNYKQFYEKCENQDNIQIINCIRENISQYIETIFKENEIDNFQNTIQECKQIQPNYSENIISCLIYVIREEIDLLRSKKLLIYYLNYDEEYNIDVLKEMIKQLKSFFENKQYFQNEHSECKYKSDQNKNKQEQLQLPQMSQISQLRINIFICIREEIQEKLKQLAKSKNTTLDKFNSYYIFKTFTEQLNNIKDYFQYKHDYIQPSITKYCQSQSQFEKLECIMDQFDKEVQYFKSNQQYSDCDEQKELQIQLVCYVQKYMNTIYNDFYPDNQQSTKDFNLVYKIISNQNKRQILQIPLIENYFPFINDYGKKNEIDIKMNFKLYILTYLYMNNNNNNINLAINNGNKKNIDVLIESFDENIIFDYFYLQHRCNNSRNEEDFFKMKKCILENKTILLFNIKKYDRNLFFKYFNQPSANMRGDIYYEVIVEIVERNQNQTEIEYFQDIYNKANEIINKLEIIRQDKINENKYQTVVSFYKLINQCINSQRKDKTNIFPHLDISAEQFQKYDCLQFE